MTGTKLSSHDMFEPYKDEKPSTGLWPNEHCEFRWKAPERGKDESSVRDTGHRR
jgi:hypothetical protein